MFVIAHNGARIWGGAERATALLLAGLAERGHRVLLLCNHMRVADSARELGVATEILHLGGDLAIGDALRLARRLRALEPAAFIVGTYRKLWLSAIGARLAGVPRVIARVGLETDAPRNLKYRLAFRYAIDAVVVNAMRIRPAFDALPASTEERVTVIHNGVNRPEPSADRATLRRSLGIPADAWVVGAVARLAPQKRLDRLIHVVRGLPASVHCVIAGDGWQRDVLVGLAAELGMADRVHFLGYRSEVADVLAMLDLMLVTSDTEGLSNSMLEALALGVPVVSTPVSGAEEALEPLPDGRRPGVVTSFDPAEIAATVRALLDAPDRLPAMSSAARERAADRFSYGRMLDRWEEVLLTGGRRQ